MTQSFNAKVNELWASDINAEIKAAQSELRRLKREQIEYADAGENTEFIEWESEKVAGLFAQKNDLANAAIEAHIAATGKRPEPAQLDRLATWLLKHAEHDDADADVLTKPQQKRRRKREFPDVMIDNKYYDDTGTHKIEPKPRMDDEGSHFTFVNFASDYEDKRKYNGPVHKYRSDDNG